jgi:hypothetical protein
MITAIVGVAVLVLVLALVIAVARDPGPPPADVALAYEDAWDRLDFEALWDLSGDELRDGLGRRDFVTAKRAAYAGQPDLGDLARDVVVEAAHERRSVAAVRTRVELRAGGAAHNEIDLAKRAGRWVVVAYDLRTDAPPPAAT